MSYALITGASAGLGADLAILFAKDNHPLILVARRQDKMQELAEKIRSFNPQLSIHIIAMDLGTPGAGKAIYDKVKELGLEVQYLVNNAGFGSNGRFHKLDLSKELQMVDLNIRALTELTHLFLQDMIAKKQGRIMNVGSLAGYQPGPYMATYYATKAYVNSFSQALHKELKNTGVTCTLLAPGATETEFAKSASVEEARLFKTQILAKSYDVSKCGYEAMMQGQSVIIPGLANKLVVMAVKFLPLSVVLRAAVYLNTRTD